MPTRERRSKNAASLAVWTAVMDRADDFCAQDLLPAFPQTSVGTLSIILALLTAKGCLLHSRSLRISPREVVVYYKVDPLFEDDYVPPDPNAARKPKPEPEVVWQELWTAAHGPRRYEDHVPAPRLPSRTFSIDEILSR